MRSETSAQGDTRQESLERRIEALTKSLELLERVLTSELEGPSARKARSRRG